MLLYYYDYYGCFIIINYYYDNNCSFLVCSYTGTNSCLTLCSSELMFSYECLNRQIICHLNFFIFCTALWKLLLKVKYELWLRPVWTQPLILLIPFVFFSLFAIFFVLFPLFKRKTRNLCLLQRENASFLFSVKFYGTDLYNFKSSYFSIHAEYSSITTKTCYKV